MSFMEYFKKSPFTLITFIILGLIIGVAIGNYNSSNYPKIGSYENKYTWNNGSVKIECHSKSYDVGIEGAPFSCNFEIIDGELNSSKVILHYSFTNSKGETIFNNLTYIPTKILNKNWGIEFNLPIIGQDLQDFNFMVEVINKESSELIFGSNDQHISIYVITFEQYMSFRFQKIAYLLSILISIFAIPRGIKSLYDLYNAEIEKYETKNNSKKKSKN